MLYVCKRAPQHGLYVPGFESGPSALKIGQTDIHRKDLYGPEGVHLFKDVPYYVADGHSAVMSEYTRSNRVRLGDYSRPRRVRAATVGGGAARAGAAAGGSEDASAVTKEDSAAAAVGGGDLQQGREKDALCSAKTAHWKSIYKTLCSGGEACAEEKGMARGCAQTPMQAPPSIGRMDDCTTYSDSFGKFGSNPRCRARVRDGKMVTARTALNAGTPRGTMYVPNYQGFIPSVPTCPVSARVARGDVVRSLDKTNLKEIYQQAIPGYGGFIPSREKNLPPACST